MRGEAPFREEPERFPGVRALPSAEDLDYVTLRVLRRRKSMRMNCPNVIVLVK